MSDGEQRRAAASGEKPLLVAAMFGCLLPCCGYRFSRYSDPP
jgi:hypothetical protein